MPWVEKDFSDDDDDDFDDDFDEPDLALPETRLQVQGDRLLRLNADGSTLMNLSLPSIVSVRFRDKFDPYSFAFAATAGGLVAIGKYVSDTNWVSCILYVLAIPLVMNFFYGIFRRTITIQRDDGPLDIVCSESKDQLQGFVLSLREMLAEQHS